MTRRMMIGRYIGHPHHSTDRPIMLMVSMIPVAVVADVFLIVWTASMLVVAIVILALDFRFVAIPTVNLDNTRPVEMVVIAVATATTNTKRLAHFD